MFTDVPAKLIPSSWSKPNKKPSAQYGDSTFLRNYGKLVSSVECSLSSLNSSSTLLSRYSDWLRAGRPRGRSSSCGRVKNYLFSTSSIPDLGPTQPSIQWVPGIKRQGREADHSSPTSAEVKKTWMLYIHSPIRLHGVALN
jgi:hypothetical protein